MKIIKPKNLVIISGITGAIGSALLAEYACCKNTCIYGISRQGIPVEEISTGGKLPIATLICSLRFGCEIRLIDIEDFVRRIDFKQFKSVTYIHGLGLYPFEVNREGEILVSNDKDGDGINDTCLTLTYQLFTFFTQTLCKNFSGKINAVLFGGIADIHHPSVHQSWWKSIEKTKVWMKSNSVTASLHLFNISSVLCPHEIITRPFVFVSTDAKQQYWLKPSNIATFVLKQLRTSKDNGFLEHTLYKKMPNFLKDYYKDEYFTPRKVAELYSR